MFCLIKPKSYSRKNKELVKASITMEFLLFQSLVLIPSVKKIQTILQTLALRGEQN